VAASATGRGYQPTQAAVGARKPNYGPESQQQDAPCTMPTSRTEALDALASFTEGAGRAGCDKGHAPPGASPGRERLPACCSATPSTSRTDLRLLNTPPPGPPATHVACLRCTSRGAGGLRNDCLRAALTTSNLAKQSAHTRASSLCVHFMRCGQTCKALPPQPCRPGSHGAPSPSPPSALPAPPAARRRRACPAPAGRGGVCKASLGRDTWIRMTPPEAR
jgi:hypothetical protein